MSRFRITECILCVLVILIGILYQYAGFPVSWTLVCLLLLFAPLPVLRNLDSRSAGLARGARILQTIVAAIPLAVILAGIVLYFCF